MSSKQTYPKKLKLKIYDTRPKKIEASSLAQSACNEASTNMLFEWTHKYLIIKLNCIIVLFIFVLMVFISIVARAKLE